MEDKNKKIVLYSLLDSCPFAVEQDCCLGHARKLSQPEKIKWANSLSESEIKLIVGRHYDCYNRRLQGID